MAIQDPMSIMAKASRLTITQLQQAIRNGTIPRDIGAMVLSQKIKEQQAAKQAQAAQQPPQPPVTQQAMAYQESPGIAALPTNLPAQGMAGGGIVAFAEGGDSTEAYNRAASESFLGKGLEAIGDAAPLVADYAPTMSNLVKTAGGYLVDKATGLRWVRNPYTGALTRARDVVENPNAGKLADMGPMASKSGIASLLEGEKPTGSVAGIMPENLAQAGAPKTEAAQKGTALIGGENGMGIAGGYRSSGKAGLPGMLGGYKVGKFDDSELRKMLAEENNPATGKPYTYEEMAERNRERALAAGVDPDLYAKQMKELEGKKELSESRRKSNEAAPWFAMSRALADVKPGEHWATSAGRGLSTYGEKKGELTEKEEARLEGIRKEANQLAVAQNAYKQAELSGNKADMAAAKAQINAVRGKMSDMGVESTKAQNEYAKTMAELQNRRDIAAMQESGAWGRASMEKNDIKALANMIIKDANAAGTPITQSEAMSEAYRISKFQGMQMGVEQRDKAANIKAITDELKTLQYAVSPDQKQRKAMLQQQLNALQYGTAGASGSAPSVVDFNSLPK